MNTQSRNKIVIRPNMKMFFIENLYTMVLLVVTVMMTGYEDDLVRIIAVTAIILVILFLCKQYWYWATYTWEISDTQIKSIKGVLNRTVDYVELYRIVDFYEHQNLFQQILGVKDVYIVSNDRTHPLTKIFGIPYSLDLIGKLNPMVKKSRKDNHIYEIANR